MKQKVQVSWVVITMCSLFICSSPVSATPEDAKKIIPTITLLLLDDDTPASFNATFTGILNDTGIDWSDTAGGVCSNQTPYPEDCHAGRDNTHDNDADGHAGFSFVKLDRLGQILPASATNWSCVGDKVTGLMWEVKQAGNNAPGDSLHDSDDYYTWYNADSSTNGGSEGKENGIFDCFGRVTGFNSTYCNTQAYVNRVNATGWCGYSSGWRLPAREELRSIVDYSRVSPSIDTTYFSQTKHSFYWSSSPSANSNKRARGIYFFRGNDGADSKNDDGYVRLVRSGQ